jgi:hypothetical protein
MVLKGVTAAAGSLDIFCNPCTNIIESLQGRAENDISSRGDPPNVTYTQSLFSHWQTARPSTVSGQEPFLFFCIAHSSAEMRIAPFAISLHAGLGHALSVEAAHSASSVGQHCARHRGWMSAPRYAFGGGGVFLELQAPKKKDALRGGA